MELDVTSRRRPSICPWGPQGLTDFEIVTESSLGRLLNSKIVGLIYLEEVLTQICPQHLFTRPLVCQSVCGILCANIAAQSLI
jgi:hypothetical protein